MFNGIYSYSFLDIGYLFEMDIILNTFTGVVKDRSGFGIINKIADYIYSGKPCTVLGTVVSGYLVQGQGHLQYKYYTSTHEILLSHLPFQIYTTKIPSLPFL
jgi:hypothetical protein